MSIRIRVYPQQGSIGVRRRRSQRMAQVVQRQQFALQQQLLRQQMMLQQQQIRGYGSNMGYGFGNTWNQSPFTGAAGGSWNPYGVGLGSGYAYPPTPPYVSASSTAWNGASWLAPVQQSNFVYQSSPLQSTWAAGNGYGWHGSW